jgi:hypothetical protein
MMYCSKYGYKLVKNANYCSNCGNSVQTVQRKMSLAKVDKMFSHNRQTNRKSRTTATRTEYKDNTGYLSDWSWGAFGLTFLWGLYHQLFLSLLMFVPLVNIVVWIMLGAYGRRWAWEKGNWTDIQSFKKSQDKWDTVGKIIFFLFITILLYGIYSNYIT